MLSFPGAIVYDVLEDHEPEYEDEVAIPKGCKVEVLQRQLSGWWKVRCMDPST